MKILLSKKGLAANPISFMIMRSKKGVILKMPDRK
jgi:hypothetical protein